MYLNLAFSILTFICTEQVIIGLNCVLITAVHVVDLHLVDLHVLITQNRLRNFIKYVACELFDQMKTKSKVGGYVAQMLSEANTDNRCMSLKRLIKFLSYSYSSKIYS